jgi:signal transduction histidine kinase/DNA-binding response OmpR family regulator/ligand-binding sensor domain-containing protein
MACPGRHILPILVVLAALAAPDRAAGELPAWVADPGFTTRIWTREDGLPTDAAHGLHLSPEGYLWVGTFDGVLRFDGVQLRLYDAGSDSGLTLNRLPYVQGGAAGQAIAWGEAPWIGVYERGGFRTLGAELGLPSAAVTDVLSDETLIVAGHGGVYRSTGTAYEPLHPDLVDVIAERLLRRRDGSLVVAVRGRGLRLVRDGRVEPFLDYPERTALLLEDRDGTVWVGTTAALLGRAADGAIVRPPLPPPLALLEPGRSGILWVATANGLYRRLAPDADWTRVSPRPCTALHEGPTGTVWAACDSVLLRNGRDEFPVPSPIVSLLEDPAGNVWLTTTTSGLVRLSPSRVALLGPDASLTTVLGDADSGFWIGGDAGVHHIGPGGRRFFPLPHPIRTLHRDVDGTILAGTFFGLFALRGDALAPYPAPEGFGRVYGIGRSISGELWLSGFSKVARRTAGGWETIDDLGEFAGGPIRFGAAAPDGSVWFASPEGPLRVNEGRVRRYADSDGLPTKRIRAIHVDERGVVWLGTEGRGVLRMTLDASGDVTSVGTIDERRGLHENGVRWVGQDDAGYLWMTSNRGVFAVARTELDEAAAGLRGRVHYRLFDESSGFRSSSTSQVGVPAALFFEGGLAVPTDRGLALLSTGLDAARTAEPPLLVEDVVVDGVAQFAGGGDVLLPAGQRSFEIRYTGLDLTNPEHVQFRYRLEGAEAHWTEAGRRRTAYFTHVPPGQHTFRVQMTGADGDWIDGGAELRIRVPAAFWETPWFRGLLALLALGAIAAAYQVRERLLRRRARMLEEMVAARTAELARQTERLSELDQAKSRFFANVSHEFRTPLTLTIGPLEDLLSGMHGDLPPGARREMKTALDSSRSVLDLVNQILDLAKLESGQFRLEARRQDLAETVRAVVQEFLPLSERRRIPLLAELPERPLAAWFDELLLRRVLRNLLSNAFKFTSEGGTVTVTLSRAAEGVAADIAVRDTGAGIAREELDRIFDRFHQAAGPTRSEPGTGIGLSLARELVDLHRGTISVSSVLGEGTTFTVRLPLDGAPADSAERFDGRAARPERSGPPAMAGGNGAPAHSTPAVRPAFEDEAAGAADAPGRDNAPARHDNADSTANGDEVADRTTILIAEDHPQVRALVRKHLAGRYRILEAGDGRRALELARKQIPDLIVTDVMMPHMDGMELTRTLKADPDIGFVPVLLLTARADVEDRVTAYDFGADAYLAKPFDARELVARVEGLIRERRRLKQLFAGAPADEPAGLASADEAYRASVLSVIRKNLADEDFGVDELARQLGQTRATLFRRFKDIGEATPSALIKKQRLEEGRRLLERGAGSVNEVAYGVGFKSVSHFCTAFREAYGKAPGQWRTERGTPAT